MAEDLGEKTEDPTERKRSQARNKGQLAKSLDLSGAIDLIAAVLLVVLFGTWVLERSAMLVRSILSGDAPGLLGPNMDVHAAATFVAGQGIIMAAPMMGVAFAAALVAQYMQVGWLLTTEPLKPDINRVNPVSGFGRLLGARNAVKTLLNVLKLTLIMVVVWMVVSHHLRGLSALPNLSVAGGFAMLGRIVLELCAWMLLIMLIIGVADWMYQRWQHTRDLRMTKAEVKDERRSMEGDEETKLRRRQMARRMVMQGIQSAVPKADVVVTNPTHFSVALKYDPETMAAPRVVAKGADYLAFRIRDVARTAGVPIIERPPLARALYFGTDVGQQIDAQHFQAVAEVLAFVYRLREGGAPAGLAEAVAEAEAAGVFAGDSRRDEPGGERSGSSTGEAD